MIHDDNGELAYLLNHNRIGVTIDALDTLVEIHPNEEYWQDKLGVAPVNLDQFEGMPKDIYESLKQLLTNYYVPKDVHEAFSEKLALADIDPKYLDDLLLVTHYYGSYRHSLLGDETKHAQAISEMLDFVDEIDDGLFEVDRLTIRGKGLTQLSPKKYELEKKFTITEPNVLRQLIGEFKQWAKTSSRYKQLFTEYSELVGTEQTAYVKTREKRDNIFIWCYDFLAENELAKSYENACMKIGVMLSSYSDLIPAFESTKSELTEKKRAIAYKREVGNYVRNYLNRSRFKKVRSNRFQNRIN